MQEAASLELASVMIADVAAQFGILQPAISINIVMENFRDGTQAKHCLSIVQIAGHANSARAFEPATLASQFESPVVPLTGAFCC